MKITREVILDLLPLYQAGEASADTRALVEEFLAQDGEFERRLRRQAEGGPLPGSAVERLRAAAVSLPPGLELQSIRRTRRLLALQRWLFGCGIAFTAVALSLQITTERGQATRFRLLLLDYPWQLGLCLVLGGFCWGYYALLRRRLRTGS